MVQLLPPNLCSECLPTVKFHQGPLDGASSQALCLSSLCPLPPLKHLVRETDAPKRLNAIPVTSIRGLMGYGPPNWSFFLPLRILFGRLRTKIAERKPSLHQLASLSHQLRSAYYPSGQVQLLVCQSIPHWKRTRFDYWDGISALICKHAVSQPVILTGLKWCLERWARQKNSTTSLLLQFRLTLAPPLASLLSSYLCF